MKKVFALLLAVCLIFSLAACGGSSSSSSGGSSGSAGVIKVGIFEPQTGDNGAGGKQQILGEQYGHYLYPTVELGGKTYDIELVYSDNESSADKAVSAANKCVAEGCAVVIGSYGSGICMAATETFQTAGLAAIAPGATNVLVTQDNDVYFRTCIVDPDQGTIDANLAKDLGVKKVYCLAMLGEDYGQGLVSFFVKAAPDLGLEIVGQDSFPEGNSDFTSYLNNAKNAGAEAIFCPCSTGYAQQIISQVASMGYNVPLLAGDTWDSGVISDACANAASKVEVYCSTFYADGVNEKFESEIKEWIKNDPTNFANNGNTDELSALSVQGYDTYLAAYNAIKNSGTGKREDVLKALQDVSFEGITGKITFKENGDCDRHEAFIKKYDYESGTLAYFQIVHF